MSGGSSQSAAATALHHLCDEHEAIVAALDSGDQARAGELVVAHIRGFYEPEADR